MYPVIPMSIGWSVWHEENGRQILEHAIKLAADVVETAAVDSDAHEARQRERPTNLYSSGIGSEYAGVDAVLSQRRGPS
jgi:hypothetical protein